MAVPQDGEAVGRVTFGLFGDVAPRTVENFRALATGQEVGCAAAQVFDHMLWMLGWAHTSERLQRTAGGVGSIDRLQCSCRRARQRMAWCCTTRGRPSIGSFQVWH